MISQCKSLCDIINSTKGDVMEVKQSDFDKVFNDKGTKKEFLKVVGDSAIKLMNQIDVIAEAIDEANVVFPTPGGPTKRITEPLLSFLIFPTAKYSSIRFFMSSSP